MQAHATVLDVYFRLYISITATTTKDAPDIEFCLSVISPSREICNLIQSRLNSSLDRVFLFVFSKIPVAVHPAVFHMKFINNISN